MPEDDLTTFARLYVQQTRERDAAQRHADVLSRETNETRRKLRDLMKSAKVTLIRHGRTIIDMGTDGQPRCRKPDREIGTCLAEDMEGPVGESVSENDIRAEQSDEDCSANRMVGTAVPSVVTVFIARFKFEDYLRPSYSFEPHAPTFKSGSSIYTCTDRDQRRYSAPPNGTWVRYGRDLTILLNGENIHACELINQPQDMQELSFTQLREAVTAAL